VHAEVFVQEDGQEGEGEAEPKDRGELSEPERGEVAPPVDRRRVDQF